MGRILAIDYGSQRCGLAWTDPQRIIATALPACTLVELLPRLEHLVHTEALDAIVVGLPNRLSGQPTHSTAGAKALAEQLEQKFPSLQIRLWDERFTSLLAERALVQAGASRKQRRDKQLINSISAVILLQHYLQANPT